MPLWYSGNPSCFAGHKAIFACPMVLHPKWAGLDSNQQCRKATDLQSAAIPFRSPTRTRTSFEARLPHHSRRTRTEHFSLERATSLPIRRGSVKTSVIRIRQRYLLRHIVFLTETDQTDAPYAGLTTAYVRLSHCLRTGNARRLQGLNLCIQEDNLRLPTECLTNSAKTAKIRLMGFEPTLPTS